MISIHRYPRYSKSDPRFYPSLKKKPGTPLVFFIHFYGGNQRILKRHIQLVNDLGYEAFSFNMPSLQQSEGSLWINGRYGLKHLYGDMIDFYLQQIPGPKILYSFSNPTAAAIEVIANESPVSRSIHGLICDSGPSGHFVQSAWNLAQSLHKDSKLAKVLFLMALGGAWSWKFHSDLAKHLSHLPREFPILSIQGKQDPLIPPWHIEKVFSGHSRLNLSTHVFQDAGHLDALKKFPAEYTQVVSEWLTKLKPLSS